MEILPNNRFLSIDETVMPSIIEPLVTLALHIIPALLLKKMQYEKAKSENSMCVGARNIATKAPSLQIFSKFINRLTRLDRQVSNLIAD